MKLHEEFKLFENMWDNEPLKEAVSSSTIRCMHALYEDDDGYVSNVGVYAGDLSEEEMENLLTEQGMSFVTCWDEYDYKTSNTYNLGDVVEVFEVSDEDIEDVAAIAGKDPEEYKNVGFFESADGKKLTEARSVVDIEADIARLERELKTARAELVSAKKTGLDSKRPKYLYTWDMYIDKEAKGSWLGADNRTLDGDWDGSLFETEAEAIQAGKEFLEEPINADLLEGPIESYTIDTIAIPLDEVSNDQLEYLGLAHLIK